MLLYKELAECYFDIEKGSRFMQKEFDFLQSEFKKYQVKKVLDAGCGTGEHVAHLNQLGYNVIGIDNAPEMLRVAKQRFPFSKYYLSDMYDYTGDYKFDAIISIFGSFNYLVDENEVLRALRNFHSQLEDGGIVILEVWHAMPLVTIKRKPLSTVARVISNERIIQRNRGFRLLKKDEEVVVEVNYIYDVDGRELNDRHVMRVFHLKEFQEFLKRAGFKMLHVYGNMDRGRVNDSTSRIIYVGQKTKTAADDLLAELGLEDLDL